MKILIAEDDPVSKRLLEGSLVSWGYEVIATNNGAAALDILQSADRPMLAILDIVMPKMTGIELYREIVKIDPLTKVILVSGDASTEYEKHFPGPDGPRPVLVKKPFTLKAFLQVVQTHLD